MEKDIIMEKLAEMIIRFVWFLNGRMGEHLWLRKDIRKWWKPIMWTLFVVTFVRFVMFPFFKIWDTAVTFINYVIWG